MSRLLWVALAVGWMAGMWYLSDQPDLATGLPQDFLLRKLAHVAEYAVLVWLWAHVVSNSWRSQRALLLASVITVLYAVLDEVHQTWVVGRSGTVRDVGIDMLGVALIWVFSFLEKGAKKEP